MVVGVLFVNLQKNLCISYSLIALILSRYIYHNIKSKVTPLWFARSVNGIFALNFSNELDTNIQWCKPFKNFLASDCLVSA